MATRIFTQALGPPVVDPRTRARRHRYEPGDIHAWPRPTWEQFARSAGLPLDDFSQPIDDAARVAFAAGAREATPARRRGGRTT